MVVRDGRCLVGWIEGMCSDVCSQENLYMITHLPSALTHEELLFLMKEMPVFQLKPRRWNKKSDGGKGAEI